MTAILSNHNGRNISCFGKKDGSIDVTISGGQTPYSIEWSTGEVSEDIGTLPAGFYSVLVTDAIGEEVREDYTLTEPENLTAQASVYVYPNGKNLSCYQCFNGSITIMPQGGVAPFTYLWTDGVATQHRYNLSAVQTQVAVTDANGCAWGSEIFTLTSPERSDWTMTGNAGTNPATQYIGTSDNKDLVFRTQGVERLRLLANGDVKVANLQFSSGYSLLFADSAGTLRSADGYATEIQEIKKPCPVPFPWLVCGNNITPNQWLGTKNNEDLIIRTNNVVRMRVDKDGKVGIGMTPPNNGSGYRLYVDQAIAAREVKVTAGNWPDYVFRSDYTLLSFEQLRAFIRTEKHLPGMLTEGEVRTAEGFELGDTQVRILRLVEEQALYILQLEERLAAIEARLNAQASGK